MTEELNEGHFDWPDAHL